MDMYDDHGLGYALLFSPPHNPTISLSHGFMISLPHSLAVSLPYRPDISFNYFHHPERQYWLDPSLQPRSSTMPFYNIRHGIPLTRAQRDDLAAKITHLRAMHFTTPSLFVNIHFTHHPRDAFLRRRESRNPFRPPPLPYTTLAASIHSF